jgi:hypothetical protein
MTTQSKLDSLRALPAEAQPPFGYDGLMARVAAQRAGTRRRRIVGATAGAALAAVLVVAGAWRVQSAPPSALASVDQPDAVAPLATLPIEAPMSANTPVLVDADTYTVVVDLEDRIAWFDDALSEARVTASTVPNAGRAHVVTLERERERLVQSLVQVRYAEAMSASW